MLHHLLRNELTLGPGPCGLRAGLAAQGGGHDLRRKVKEVSQVLDTFIGQVPVEVTPGKLLLDIPTGLQGLEEKHMHYAALTLWVRTIPLLSAYHSGCTTICKTIRNTLTYITLYLYKQYLTKIKPESPDRLAHAAAWQASSFPFSHLPLWIIELVNMEEKHCNNTGLCSTCITTMLNSTSKNCSLKLLVWDAKKKKKKKGKKKEISCASNYFKQ